MHRVPGLENPEQVEIHKSDIARNAVSLGGVETLACHPKALRYSAHVASSAVVVEAKDDEGAQFYKRYGFISFPNRSNRLFLPTT